MSDFATWRADFSARAPALAAFLPKDLAPLPEVAAQASAQPEFTLSAAQYMARALPEPRIANGRAACSRHRDLLETLTARTGVPGEIITAIWGVETDFGRVRGDVPVLAALATLAHNSPRKAFFEAELRAALRLVATGAAPVDFTGSWAGASGHCQFMPSAVLNHAIASSGEGPADIWSDDPSDALASIAGYLAAHGWQAGKGWFTQVAPDAPESLFIPTGLPGPAFATWANFKVLLSYNRASLYALAVGLLADAIAGRAIPPQFPDRPPLARAQIARLQQALTAGGFDTRGSDGLIGPNTIAAIRDFQKSRNLAPDGFPSRDLALHLGINTSGEREG